MSELKKLETTGYSSKLDEIAKNDTEVFLKVKLSGRRTFGEYEFEQKNGFAVKFGNHIDVLDLDKCEVYQLEQPQLNENQQIVLEWLKEEHFDSYVKSVLSNLYFYINMTAIGDLESIKIQEMVKAYEKLSQGEFAQVIEVFSRWAQEQEEE